FMKKFRVTTQKIKSCVLSKIIIPITQEADKDQLLESLSHFEGFDVLRALESFEAKQGEYWRILHDTGELFFVGLGKNPDLATIYKVLRKISNDQRKNLDSEIGIFVHPANFLFQNA